MPCDPRLDSGPGTEIGHNDYSWEQDIMNIIGKTGLYLSICQSHERQGLRNISDIKGNLFK